MAPEGPVGPRSDIFSLGKLLYEIGTGRDRLSFLTSHRGCPPTRDSLGN